MTAVGIVAACSAGATLKSFPIGEWACSTTEEDYDHGDVGLIVEEDTFRIWSTREGTNSGWVDEGYTVLGEWSIGAGGADVSFTGWETPSGAVLERGDPAPEGEWEFWFPEDNGAYELLIDGLPNPDTAVEDGTLEAEFELPADVGISGSGRGPLELEIAGSSVVVTMTDPDNYNGAAKTYTTTCERVPA